jgi:hypothetical protein
VPLEMRPPTLPAALPQRQDEILHQGLKSGAAVLTNHWQSAGTKVELHYKSQSAGKPIAAKFQISHAGEIL